MLQSALLQTEKWLPSYESAVKGLAFLWPLACAQMDGGAEGGVAWNSLRKKMEGGGWPIGPFCVFLLRRAPD